MLNFAYNSLNVADNLLKFATYSLDFDDNLLNCADNLFTDISLNLDNNFLNFAYFGHGSGFNVLFALIQHV